MADAHTHGEVIHEHYGGDSSSTISWIIGLIVLLVLAWVLFAYGLPFLRAPANPQINVPSQIDVNLNQPGQGGGAPAPPAQ